MKLHTDPSIPPPTPLTQEEVFAQNQTDETLVLPDGTGVEEISTKVELTDDVKLAIKARYGTRAKKTTLLGSTFIFLCANRADWDELIDGWRSQMESQRVTVTDELFARRLIESFVIFPSVGLPFEHAAQDSVYWNSLPAGVQPTLARLIEHHAGFIVPELMKNDELIVEDLFFDEEPVERPSDETIEAIKSNTDMPCRLIRFYRSWFIIRAMRWSEARYTRKRILEDANGDHEIRQLANVILYGPKDFDCQPAGLVPMLLAHLRQVSGLPQGDEPILHEEAEDL